MLDPKTEKAVAQVAEEAKAAFGQDLVSVVLYGSAAGDDFVAGRSDLNVAIVLEQLGVAHLQALRPCLPKWHKLGVAAPLMLDRRFLDRGRDVFPMEFLDIKAQHRLLHGEDVFGGLPIDSRHLRYQSEHEARGKLLRLRLLYAETGGSRKRLEAMLLESTATFLVIMRNLIRLRTAQAHTRSLAVLDQFEEHFGVSFPTMRQLVRIKQGTAQWTTGADETFSAYHGEVERLVDLIDRMLPEGAPAQAGTGS
ncbi:MAG: hypothetical protein ACE5I7_09795 [Candidatus Binatia bacterium]